MLSFIDVLPWPTKACVAMMATFVFRAFCHMYYKGFVAMVNLDSSFAMTSFERSFYRP